MSMAVFWIVMPCGFVGCIDVLESAALKRDAVCSSETLVLIYNSTGHHNPEGRHGPVIRLDEGVRCGHD
jgi:hypothetical protein